ncbi:MAG: RNA-binding protein [Deltaproteobacteria bacterium]|nr:RNA-binding protein [Deltaproteobacteria bacterium]
MPKKLFVGNISYRATEFDLQRKFGEIGEIVSVQLVTDRFSGKSKGIAFVEMATEELAQEAIKKLNRTAMYGRGIIVSEAKPRKENSEGRR